MQTSQVKQTNHIKFKSPLNSFCQNIFLGVKDEIDSDITQTEKRRDEIMSTSLHEDKLPHEETSDLSEELPEVASPTEEAKVSKCCKCFELAFC